MQATYQSHCDHGWPPPKNKYGILEMVKATSNLSVQRSVEELHQRRMRISNFEVHDHSPRRMIPQYLRHPTTTNPIRLSFEVYARDTALI
jgi:hypothetical protein